MSSRSALHHLLIVLPLLAIAHLNCSSSPLAGGNSSETGSVAVVQSSENSIMVIARDTLLIALFDTGYLPFSSQGFARAAMGFPHDSVVFSSLQKGMYNLLIRDTSKGTALFARNISVGSSANFNQSFDSLFRTGGIRGPAVSVRGDTLTWTQVYIPGSPFWSYTGPSGSFAIEDMPPGTYPILFFGSKAFSSAVYADPAILTTETMLVTVIADSITLWHR